MRDSDDEMIGRAFRVACRAHAGQTDKSGAAYIGHVARGAANVPADASGTQQIVVALLHDVVEDTQVTLDDLAADFPPAVIAAVDAISRRPSEERPAYYARVAADPIARAVKAADIDDNLSPARMAALDPATRARLERKYAAARAALRLETPSC